MPVLDHWHPVFQSALLRERPAGVTLDGRPIALFRLPDGTVGAVDDQCVHRRAKLSLGRVVGDRLQCPYHGWTYTPHGGGESPGHPKLHAQTASYETREAHGCVWLRHRGAATAFPEFRVAGSTWLGVLQHTAPAPLEVTLDNFTEIEHTPVAHDGFGYDLDHLKDVRVEFHPTPTSVRVVNQGVPKPLPWWQRRLLGIRKDWLFNDDWTTYFSPVYTEYEHWWSDPHSSRTSKVHWRYYMFFWPIDDQSTSVWTLLWATSRYPIGPDGGLRLFRNFLLSEFSREIDLDVKILSSLADYGTGIEGMKLSRFDRVLGLTRERIRRIYRGEGERRPLPVATEECRACEADTERVLGR